jgi:hypothetical protein
MVIALVGPRNIGPPHAQVAKAAVGLKRLGVSAIVLQRAERGGEGRSRRADAIGREYAREVVGDGHVVAAHALDDVWAAKVVSNTVAPDVVDDEVIGVPDKLGVRVDAAAA